MNRYLFILAISTLSAGLLFSCKKNKDTATPACLLSSVTDSTTSVQSVTQFNYDNANRLASIVVTGQNACKRTFQYFGNTVVFSVTDTTPGIQNEVDSIVLNSAGYIQTLSSHYTTTGVWDFQRFFYDSTGQVSTGSITTENGEPGDTLQYLTVNGDLIYEKVKGQTVNKNNFTYYPTQGILYGDPTDFRQLLYYGAYYYKNVHMLNVLAAPGVSYKAYTYTIADNRISQATLRLWLAGSADTVTHIMSYSYSCK